MARFLFFVCLWLVAGSDGLEREARAARFLLRPALCETWSVSSRYLVGWLAIREEQDRVWGKLLWREGRDVRREAEVELETAEAELLRQQVDQMLRGWGPPRLHLDRRRDADGQCEVWRIRA